MILSDVIKEKVQSIAQLPSMPSVAARVLAMVDDTKTTTSALGKIIATDQALTAKVLKIANSPFYGFPKRISTIEFAIIVLGYDALKEILFSTSLAGSLKDDSDAYFDSKAFWDHSLASGVLARRIARDLGYRVNGEVFVAGLLHDMGISVLHGYFREEYQRIVGIVRETDLTFLEAEESVLGVTHAEVGSWLGERWNFPDHLVEALLLHHTPARAVRNPDLVALVHCADVLAYRLPGMKVEFDKGVELNQAALNRLQLNPSGRIEDYLASSTPMMPPEPALFEQPEIPVVEGGHGHEG